VTFRWHDYSLVEIDPKNNRAVLERKGTLTPQGKVSIYFAKLNKKLSL